ncbi:hypothetical protein TNCV_2917381 [Trichonephila clavipes]|nr:hypothetical protein TNCV_2917381 [Trichonephila clavipes]
MTIIDLKNIIIDSKDYEEEFVRAQLSVISEERVERETEEKIARQHAIQQLRWESELNELRLQIESIRSNVKRTSCAEDRKNTSSNYRISIGSAGEHKRETSPAVLMAEATIPATTPIKEENGMDDLRVVYVKVKGEHEMGEVKDSNMELNDLRHGVVPVSKNLVNDMLICSFDFEGLIENWQMVSNPAILREPSGEEGIINLVNSKSICNQEVVTDLLPETQSLSNVPNGDLVAVKINGSNVQTNGQGIKESKREVAFTCVFKNRILYSNRRGQPRKECSSEFIDSILVQCCRDLITGIVKLELKAGLEVFKVRVDILWTITSIGCFLSLLGLKRIFLAFILHRNWKKKRKRFFFKCLNLVQ